MMIIVIIYHAFDDIDDYDDGIDYHRYLDKNRSFDNFCGQLIL